MCCSICSPACVSNVLHAAKVGRGLFVHGVICTHTFHSANVMYMCAPLSQVDGQTRESGEEETAATTSPGLSFLFVFVMLSVMVTFEWLDVTKEMSLIMPLVSYKAGAHSALQ